LYDLHLELDDAKLRDFVAKRNPKRIGVDMSDEMGTADGLSHTVYLHLRQALGAPYADRLVSAERLVSNFRSRHVQMEIVAFAEATELSRTLVEQALSNDVITPEKTTLADVAWWLLEQLRVRSLGSSFGTPSVFILGPEDSQLHISDDRIIHRGDLLAIDWGLVYLNAWTDMKRSAYVLKPGETAPPDGVQQAFRKALAIRDVLHKTIKPGPTGQETLDLLNRIVGAMPGYVRNTAVEDHQSSPYEAANSAAAKRLDPDEMQFIIGSHSSGDLAHGSGPWMGPFVKGLNPMRQSEHIKPTNMFSIEIHTSVVIPEWGGKRVPMPLEDMGIVTERGVEWLAPPADHILLIK
jgi:Xaa-Pro aminopeptidase